MDYSAPATTF